LRSGSLKEISLTGTLKTSAGRLDRVPMRF
jgi:hypothetical protein